MFRSSWLRRHQHSNWSILPNASRLESETFQLRQLGLHGQVRILFGPFLEVLPGTLFGNSVSHHVFDPITIESLVIRPAINPRRMRPDGLFVDFRAHHPDQEQAIE